MTVTDGIKPNVELPMTGGGFYPPGPPDGGDGSPNPDNERGRLMRLIYNARGARGASLRYLRERTGFSSTRLWRAVEDLEDLGYVEIFREEPDGPVSRWLARRENPNERVFASTFLALTEAGRHSPELEESLAKSGGPERRPRPGRVSAAIGGLGRLPSKLRGLPAKLAGTLAAEWRAAGGGDPERRALARLNLIACGLGTLCLVGSPACALVLVAPSQTG